MGLGYKVEYYLSGSSRNPVKEFLDSLSSSQQTKILRIFQYLESFGLQSALPHVKKLTGTPLWEIRVLGQDNIRVLYVISKKETVLVLHGFIKKSQKMPPSEINTAVNRYEDYLARVSRGVDR